LFKLVSSEIFYSNITASVKEKLAYSSLKENDIETNFHTVRNLEQKNVFDTNISVSLWMMLQLKVILN
jgi:hypothetical protein